MHQRKENAMTTTGRLTGIKNAQLIDTSDKLVEVRESLTHDSTRWMLTTNLDWKANGFVIHNDVIYVPRAKNGKTTNGDIVASVGDYVLNLQDGRKTIVFTPEIKERIARNDFSWFTN
jgi:hypothetical protein